jgi:hypothetical protein
MENERRRDYKQPEKLIEETVYKTLTGLGFDLRDAPGIQQDIAYLRKLRRGAGNIKTVTVNTCIGAVVLGVMWVMLEGLRTWANNGMSH